MILDRARSDQGLLAALLAVLLAAAPVLPGVAADRSRIGPRR